MIFVLNLNYKNVVTPLATLLYCPNDIKLDRKGQTHLLHHILEGCGKDWPEVARRQCRHCWAIDQWLRIFTICLVEQALTARPLTPVSFDATNLEAITPIPFLVGNKNVCLQNLPCAEVCVDHRKLFRQTQAYADIVWNRFRKEYLPTLNKEYICGCGR